MSNTAVITGAGSGVGRALALALAEEQWNVAILGRRLDTLEETAQLAGENQHRILPVPCDIGRAEEVDAMAKKVLEKFGTVHVLVNAAGTNIPKRSWAELNRQDYHRLMDTNIHGAYYCVQAFLPQMRERKSGTIVNIVSEAGRQATPKSGVAYVVSKFGMVGLNQSINAEERQNGIRACAILPGDIDTPLLNLRPNPPDAAARERMLHPEDVAQCALLAIRLPQRALVEEILIRPQ